MSVVKVLNTNKQRQMSEANGLLNDALRENYENVLILGEKDGRMYLNDSYTVDVAKTLGHIELIKSKYLEGLG